MSTITWLHFSDLHLCHPKSGWEADQILKALSEDLSRLQSDYGLRPDFIFFTGDAVFGHVGKAGKGSINDQFEDATILFEEIRQVFSPHVSSENIFIVPGNHDINRTKVNELNNDGLNQRLQGECISVGKKLDQLIHDGDVEWKDFMNRLADYHNFLKESGYDHLLQDPKRLIYAVIREIHGVKVGIAGLNSVWSCYKDKEKGKIWLAGHWQIQTLQKKIDTAGVKIALMHHPFNWINQNEDPRIKREMENHFSFFLHGHEHEDWVAEGVNGFTSISAGAGYGDSESETGYNIINLNLNEGRGEVQCHSGFAAKTSL